MIQEFENRLAVVLGDQLAAPFANRVFVAGLEPDDALPKVRVAAVKHQPWLPDFGSSRTERIPGNQDFRRILRLNVEVVLDVEAAPTEGRPERRVGLDRLLYFLEAPTMADGSQLETPADQGFLIEEMKLVEAHLPLVAQPTEPSQVILSARGWFWPAGQVGETGVAIEQTHIRIGNMDIELRPEKPEIRTGGPAVPLTLAIRGGGFRLANGQPPAALGLESLALELGAANGGPGLGAVQGDAVGANGLVLVNVDNQGLANLTYTPPAQKGVDLLAISLAQSGVPDAQKQAGKILGKLKLEIGAP